MAKDKAVIFKNIDFLLKILQEQPHAAQLLLFLIRHIGNEKSITFKLDWLKEQMNLLDDRSLQKAIKYLLENNFIDRKRVGNREYLFELKDRYGKITWMEPETSV